jgi:hypothetical protein
MCSRRGARLARLGAGLVVFWALPAGAQSLPSEPLSFGAGRVTIGGDISATFSCTDAANSTSRVCADDTGFFNYTDYEHSTLRMLRVDVSASVRATDRLSFLGEVRSEDAGHLQPYALYARIRPWTSRAIDFQVGRVPPTFGAFARRTYATDNPLIGYPLAYQYLTSIRTDAVPADADELIRMRGRGWLSSFSVGAATPTRGLPLVNAFRWDTGVQFHAAGKMMDATVALTTGSLANPLVGDDNSGKQVAARFALHPAPGFVVGVSGAQAPYLTRDAADSAGVAGDSSSFTQSAFGADLEYSRGYYVLRAETVVSSWRVPIVREPALSQPLRAVATMIEGRYKIRPGLYAAARFDHLGFSDIAGSTRTAGWEAPVTRVEIGGGYSIVRNLLLKLSYQRNTRPAGRTTRLGLGAAQLVFWF